eukprot:6354605-Amphidinium_carterae.1
MTRLCGGALGCTWLQQLIVPWGHVPFVTGGVRAEVLKLVSEPVFFLIPWLCVKALPCLHTAATCAWPFYVDLCQATVCVCTEHTLAKVLGMTNLMHPRQGMFGLQVNCGNRDGSLHSISGMHTVECPSVLCSLLGQPVFIAVHGDTALHVAWHTHR